MDIMTFDEQAIEAAAKAIYEGRNGKGCKPWSLLPKSHKEPYLKDAPLALTAAHQSMVQQGLAREGTGDVDHKHEGAEWVFSEGRLKRPIAPFPVTMYRRPTA